MGPDRAVMPDRSHLQPDNIHLQPDRDHLHPPQPHSTELARRRRKIILCFDGTGNKFKGNDGDTNILKIFRMLDRSGPEQFHYYQPGIGTYITNGTLSRVHLYSRCKSWYQKAMDAAVGTSFDQHVIGGYKFLMRYYSPGDDIILFGFSRGAYTARFLAEMLDHVGLVSQGNEEMIMFAWKTFSNWQQRQDGKGWGQRKEEMYNYMKAFRETFARPVRRVRFLGLFDTVNSVPRFENAWLKRSKGFPYTARSTARVIRHAVGIDERRAKFRQDLVEKIQGEIRRRRSFKAEKLFKNAVSGRRYSSGEKPGENGYSHEHEDPVYHTQRHSPKTLTRSANLSHDGLSVGGSGESMTSLNIHLDIDSDDEDERAEQDIEEVWFPGAHGDIGGGWDLPEGERPLSHGPLVWMVYEARKAGVVFDKQRMMEHNCWLEEYDHDQPILISPNLPTIEVSGSSPTGSIPTTPAGFTASAPALIPISGHSNGTPIANGSTSNSMPIANGSARNSTPITNNTNPQRVAQRVNPQEYLMEAYTRGKIHDCLSWPSGGLTLAGTLGWKMMEFLPFRRMDLQADGSWKAIIWPLPRGEVRDIPDSVKIHTSVIKRMQADPTYRPGNLLVGGGGRGVRVAPESVGMGQWVVLRDEGSLVGEVLVKKETWDRKVVGKETGGDVGGA